MGIRALQRSRGAIIAIALVFALGACGDQGDSNGTGDSNGAAADGAASPEELIEKMQAAAGSDDFAAIIPLIVPDQRAMISFVMMMAPEMMIGMGEAMAGMGGAEGKDEAAAKFAKLKEDWATLKKKHKIPETDDGMPEGLNPQDKDAMIAFMNEKMGHVDHVAFVNDTTAFLAEMGDEKDSSGNAFDKLKGKLINLKVEGDKGSVQVEGQDQTLMLLKVGGRWYADLKEMK